MSRGAGLPKAGPKPAQSRRGTEVYPDLHSPVFLDLILYAASQGEMPVAGPAPRGFTSVELPDRNTLYARDAERCLKMRAVPFCGWIQRNAAIQCSAMQPLLRAAAAQGRSGTPRSASFRDLFPIGSNANDVVEPAQYVADIRVAVV